MSRAEAIAAVGTLPTERAVFVGIDGAGGAGKSTLARELKGAHPRVVVVSTDDLQGPGVAEWDWGRLRRQVIEPLLAGRTARYELWSWGAEIGRGWRTVPAGALLVVEGVSATRREFDVPWDLTIWVDAAQSVRRQRTHDRDGNATMHSWRRHWWPSEEAYIAHQRPQDRVDLIVDGAEPLPG